MKPFYLIPRILLTTIITGLFLYTLNAQNIRPYITVWKSDNVGSSGSDKVTLPAYGSYDYYWEDVDDASINGTGNAEGQHTITFPKPGTYRIEMVPTGSDPFHRIKVNYNDNRKKLLRIEQWGDVEWSSFHEAYGGKTTKWVLIIIPVTVYYGVPELKITATDAPDLSSVSDMSYAFTGCGILNAPYMNTWDVSNVETMACTYCHTSYFNAQLNNWDVSNVTSMLRMFWEAESFNAPLNDWDVGKVKNMSSMFSNAYTFNQELNSWNVKNVESMAAMFKGTKAFNQELNNWNVSSVTTMKSMFEATEVFNQELDNWNVSSVTTMESMFEAAEVFNRELNSWNVKNVESMASMFKKARTFNQELNNWNVGSVTTMESMFEAAEVFNREINSWNVKNVENMASMFKNTKAFNQELNNWNVSSVTTMGSMFEAAEVFNRELNSWNVKNVENMASMFKKARTFNQELNNWNVSSVTTMGSMFEAAEVFNRDLNNWNVRNVTTMDKMFMNAKAFNGEISDWNTIRVKSMKYMFSHTPVFNQDLNQWSVDSVTNMAYMFDKAEVFNGNIKEWDVSSVTDMSNMFRNAEQFNQDIGDWDVANVTRLQSLFQKATVFNQNIRDWDVSNVTNMASIFTDASSFNQNLGDWEVENATSISFDNSGMSCENYSLTLYGWSQNEETKQNVTLYARDMEFSPNIEEFREKLSSEFSWSIRYDTKGECYIPINPFVTVWKTDNNGVSEDNEILVPASGNFSYSWENIDNPSETGKGTSIDATTISFPSAGTYRLSMQLEGDPPYLDRIDFNDASGTTDAQKLIELEQWGDARWTSMENMFKGAKNLKITAVDMPELVYVTNMAHAFEGTAIDTISGIENWDVREITDMNSMFADAESFNQAISRWDVSQVENMDRILSGARAFNQNLADWDLANITSIGIDNTAISCLNYSQALDAWSDRNSTAFNINLNAKGLKFSPEAEERKEKLIEEYNWTITDDGYGDCFMFPVQPYITVWKLEGTQTEITIPAEGDFDYHWEDVNNSDVNGEGIGSGETTILFPDTGTYRLGIYRTAVDPIHHIDMRSSPSKGELSEVEQWGDIEWSSMAGAYSGTENLQIIATDIPNTEKVEDMSQMFENSGISSVPNMNKWDVSKVKNMDRIFDGAGAFDEDISDWDVSKVENMYRAFAEAKVFNRDISQWNTSMVRNMDGLFKGAELFNQDIGEWDMNRVESLNNTFAQAKAFNQDIGKWNVGRVESMNNTFAQAENFNQDISDWNVSRVESMNNTFAQAEAFNQDIGKWNVSNVEFMDKILTKATTFNQSLAGWDLNKVRKIGLNESGIDCENYSLTLQTWAINNYTNDNVILDASGLNYSEDVIIDKTILENELGWAINDSGIGPCTIVVVEPFITIWKSDNEGESDDNEIQIKLEGNYRYSWESIDDETVNDRGVGTDNLTIKFPESGIYKVEISRTVIDPIHRIEFSNISDNRKLLEVRQWGDVSWSSFNHAFYGAENLKITASDVPDLSKVKDMAYAFAYTGIEQVPEINEWNVSNVNNMSYLFYKAENFNGKLDKWDVSQANNMKYMFSGASTFNSDIGQWDVSNVLNMSSMFSNAVAFNIDLNGWNVSNVKDMHKIFSSATQFNQDLNAWDVSNVKDMSYMFYGASAFNGEISVWEVSQVKDMAYLFRDAVNFNQDISGWDVSNVENMRSILASAKSFNHSLAEWDLSSLKAHDNPNDDLGIGNSGIDCENYSTTLDGWAMNPNTPKQINLDASGLQFDFNSAGTRSELVNSLTWVIQGDEAGNCMNTTTPYVLVIKVKDADRKFELPAEGSYYYYWENIYDSKINNSGEATDAVTIEVPRAGNYRVEIVPTGNTPFHNIRFGNTAGQADNASKLIEISQWGEVEWSSMEYAYTDAYNLQITATDIPQLNKVENMAYAFANTGITHVSRIDQWNVSHVKNMAYLFSGAMEFNGDISGWDISNVKTMTDILSNAINFNYPLADWDPVSISHSDSRENDIGLGNSGLDCENYSETLYAWMMNSSLNQNLIINAAGLSYSIDLINLRNNITDELNWTITGDSEGDCRMDDITAVEKLDIESLTFYPNPTSDILNIAGVKDMVDIQIIDMYGTVVHNVEAIRDNVQIDVNEYSAGIYFVKLTAEDGRYATHKIVKQ